LKFPEAFFRRAYLQSKSRTRVSNFPKAQRPHPDIHLRGIPTLHSSIRLAFLPAASCDGRCWRLLRHRRRHGGGRSTASSTRSSSSSTLLRGPSVSPPPQDPPSKPPPQAYRFLLQTRPPPTPPRTKPIAATVINVATTLPIENEALLKVALLLQPQQKNRFSFAFIASPPSRTNHHELRQRRPQRFA
jgi:hypothetical protein